MRTGLEIFVTTLRQILSNLGVALRVTVVPLVLVVLLGRVAGPLLYGAGQFWGVAVLLLGPVLLLAAWAWAAIGWHRFVLLGERPRGLVPSLATLRPYLGKLAGLLLVGALPGMLLGFVLLLIEAASAAWPLPTRLLMHLFLLALLQAAILRIGVILPGVAAGERMRLLGGWTLSRPLGGAILIVTLCNIVFATLLGLLALPMLLRPTPPALWSVFNLTTGWLSAMVFIGLWTTIYARLLRIHAEA